MHYFKSAGIYAVANACIALLGLVLTIAIGRALGVAKFGEFASFLALQNIWAALGFMRMETRIATSASMLEANRVLLAGFLAGGSASLLMTIGCVLLFGIEGNYWLVFVSGFALCVFDATTLRFAFSGLQKRVILNRAMRIICPLLIALAAALLSPNDVNVLVLWQTGGMLVLALLAWRGWLRPRRWIGLTRSVWRRYRAGLVPSLVLCSLNGIWLNALTPFLNAFSSPADAGQFSMLQRVLGGSLGLISTATSMVFARRDYVRSDLGGVTRIFLINLGCSVLFCLVFAVPFLGGLVERILGSGWDWRVGLYVSTSAFLILSFSIGAVSMLAVRLRDEWFLAIWQALALMCWAAVFALLPPSTAIDVALDFGALMYVILGARWFVLLRKNDRPV